MWELNSLLVSKITGLFMLLLYVMDIILVIFMMYVQLCGPSASL